MEAGTRQRRVVGLRRKDWGIVGTRQDRWPRVDEKDPSFVVQAGSIYIEFWTRDLESQKGLEPCCTTLCILD